jgi:type IV secretory pathway TrbD component
MAGDRASGFTAPVHRALTQPMLLAGAPRAIALLNGTLAAALGLGLRLWLAVWASGWSAMAWRSGPLAMIPTSSMSDAATCGFPRGWRSSRCWTFANTPVVPKRQLRLPAMGRHDRPRRDPQQGRFAFQRTAGFRGPDLESVDDAEVASVAARLNNALRRLGSGWAILVEAPPRPGHGLSAERLSRSLVSALVDMERRQAFLEEGAHFESRYFLTLVFLPPAERAGRLENLFVEGREQGQIDWRGRSPPLSIAPIACWP